MYPPSKLSGMGFDLAIKWRILLNSNRWQIIGSRSRGRDRTVSFEEGCLSLLFKVENLTLFNAMLKNSVQRAYFLFA